jgi:hypothetical protein
MRGMEIWDHGHKGVPKQYKGIERSIQISSLTTHTNRTPTRYPIENLRNMRVFLIIIKLNNI